MAAAVVEIASAAAARCVDAGFGPVADAANRARAIAAMHLFDAADGWSVVAHPRAFLARRRSAPGERVADQAEPARGQPRAGKQPDRKSVVSGKGGSVRVELG